MIGDTSLMLKQIIQVFTLALISGNAIAADKVPVGDFSAGNLSGWEQKSFSGTTSYNIVSDSGRKALKASSNKTASGLVRKIKVDLNKTPFLNWSWKVDGQLKGLNEQSKAGDDYAARVYVIIDGGLFPWNSKALNYVWSSNQNRGASWGNAYLPKNAKMTAVRGQQDRAGVWQKEKRNVKQDFKTLYGKNLTKIDAVAVMTDTDNGKGQVTAVYGDIFFTAQ
ncbi:DUF3047 family protein [Cocleimonas flava]|uniref:DUF3047 family protein n=2 Tax=Thiotrichaceae TaxID=135617 RepID=A0A4R1EZX2_9GAMM|nr:DUF3047 family protein [Cocleimonas flava]